MNHPLPGSEAVESQAESAADDTTKQAAAAARPTRNLHRLARYRPALQELGLVLCRSLFLPLLIGMAAWELRDGYDTSSLSGAICHAAFLMLPTIFLTRILCRSLRNGGLVRKFFGWSDELTCGMQKCVTTIQWMVLPLYFSYLALETFELGEWHDSLGRLFFMGAMFALAMGLARAAVQFRGWSKLRFEGANRVACRLFSWLVFAVALSPMAICGMSLLGYQYGAEQFGQRLLVSVLLTICTAVLTGFASHLLLVTQYKVKYRRLLASSLAADGNGSSNGNVEKRVDVDAIDIHDISSQVNRLLAVLAGVGLLLMSWQIWGSVLPTNGYLDQVHLWKGPLGDAGEISWITLSDLLSGLVVAVLTVVLSRNLPGLLEITVLERLPLDRGGRYAISFVCRYVVSIVGTLLACQLLGFSWKSLQWLAAGLTVGLGFGLQEIFANLVSGIIILIERPVRVGDFVTVNGTSGTVIRMQLRATTIQDNDNRELIVPNKKFITEDVMNWTLTDSVSRIIFNVGVAYGSDTDLVEAKLLEVARKHPLVVHTPQPCVVFSAFGDSTLNFELRVHVPNRDVYPVVQHQINMQIDRAFRVSGIEIAFPQQEIHIRPSAMQSVQQALTTPTAQGVTAVKNNATELPVREAA